MTASIAASLEVNRAEPRVGRSWSEPLLLFVCVFLLYAATSPGDVIGDTEMRWAIATRLVDTGWFDLPAHSDERLVEGLDGKWYFFTGPAQPVLLTPMVIAGRWLATLPLPIRADAELYGQFLASLLLFPALGAAVVVAVYLIALEVGCARRTALLLAAIVGLGTMHWHNSVNTYEESQTGLCAVLALWAVVRAWNRGGLGYPLLACAACGLGVLIRVSFVCLAAPLLACGLWFDAAQRADWHGRLARLRAWAAAAVLGLFPLLGLVAFFNYARFGAVMETGYGLATLRLVGRGLFDTPFFEGLGGLLVSPGKSVFLFNPVLVLAVPGVLMLWKVHRPLAATILAVFAGIVLFHARYTFWAGDLAWGPRYLSFAMGIFLLGLIPWFQARRRRVLIGFVAVSVAVQLASVVYGFGLEFFQDRRHGTIPDGYVWRPAESQLFCRFRNIALHLAGRRDYRSIPPAKVNRATCQVPTASKEVERQHALAFFPFKAYATMGNAKLFKVLLLLWGALLASLGLLVGWWRPWRRQSVYEESSSGTRPR